MDSYKQYKEYLSQPDLLRARIVEIMLSKNYTGGQISREIGCTWHTVKTFISNDNMIPHQSTLSKIINYIMNYDKNNLIND